MSPATKFFHLSNLEALEFFILEFYSGGSGQVFIGCKNDDRFEYKSSANTSGLGTELELGRTHPSLYWV